MNIKNELIKRLDDHGYKLNDEGNIVIKFSKLNGNKPMTVEQFILEIDENYIEGYRKDIIGDRQDLLVSTFRSFLSITDDELHEIADCFDPENISKVMELLKLTHDILDEITSDTLIPVSQNEIPKRYQTQSGKNFIDVLRNEMMSHERFLGFLEGNVYKYVFRYRNKGGKKDLKKAKHYLDLLEAEIDE